MSSRAANPAAGPEPGTEPGLAGLQGGTLPARMPVAWNLHPAATARALPVWV